MSEVEKSRASGRSTSGRIADPRLGSLTDTIYEFAEKHSMKLENLYYKAPAWMFTWERSGLNREIAIEVTERDRVELYIGTTAWRDDLDRKIRSLLTRPRRAYVLYLPTSPSILLDTLELARQDVELCSVQDLDGESELDID